MRSFLPSLPTIRLVGRTIILAMIAAFLSRAMLGQALFRDADLSVDQTLAYMNKLLDTSLYRSWGGCSSSYLTGHIFVEKASKKIWYSRRQSTPDTSCYLYPGYFGARADEIDPASIRIEGAEISIGCVNPQAFATKSASKLSKGRLTECIQYWTAEGPSQVGQGETHESCSRNAWCSQGLLTLDLQHAAFVSHSNQFFIDPKNDEDAMERFVRAFKHLVIAVRALPGGDPADPFSGR